MLAVYEAVEVATKRGPVPERGPSLINAVTYRWRGTRSVIHKSTGRAKRSTSGRKRSHRPFQHVPARSGRVDGMKGPAGRRQRTASREEAVEYAKMAPEPSLECLYDGV